MIHNTHRIGNFTSSGIAALMTDGKQELGLGKPATTYIEERNMERRLGRSLDKEENAHSLTWGKFLEDQLFALLGIEYQLVSKETLIHPIHEFWSGSPDANKFDEGKTVVDIKCPITLKSFCQLVDPLYDGFSGIEAMKIIRDKHPSGEDYYWQLVSNSILTESKFAELIVYCPYFSEIKEIKEMASELDSSEQYKFYWIANAHDDELPYLPDDGFYKNINVIRFEVPVEDKIALTERVVKCGELLKIISK